MSASREPDDRWELLAECISAPPDVFFPERGEAQDNRGEEAKSWCARCPVAKECLRAAVSRRERHGVWGGAGEPTRRRLSRLTGPSTPDTHPDKCRCEFCVAVDAHLRALRRAFAPSGAVRHGRWESFVHASCRCRACDADYKRSGRP